MQKFSFRSRRKFVADSLLAGLGAGWLAGSSSWAARFLRARLAEVGRAVPRPAHRPDPGRWSDNALTLAWLGHASVLINFYGVRILTDPAFFNRIGASTWLGTIGPKRLLGCALRPEELPEIDLVLVSHAHFDHLDIPSLASVRGRPWAVMARDTSDLLPRKAYAGVRELRWDEAVTLTTRRGTVQVRGLEVRHWGARLRNDTYRGYNGYIVEREGRKLLFGGDTAETALFAGYRRYGPFAAALMPVGAYDPWIRSHCTPEQAVGMATAAGAERFVPIHHQTFRLSSEPVAEPLERTEAALAREPERLALRHVGETRVLCLRGG